MKYNYFFEFIIIPFKFDIKIILINITIIKRQDIYIYTNPSKY